MRRDKIIYLIPYIYDKDEIGNSIATEGLARKIFAKKESIRRNEFYQAAVTSFKPEITFRIWKAEYKDESILKYKNEKYSIIRTFEISDKEIELTCEKVIGNG